VEPGPTEQPIGEPKEGRESTNELLSITSDGDMLDEDVGGEAGEEGVWSDVVRASSVDGESRWMLVDPDPADSRSSCPGWTPTRYSRRARSSNATLDETARTGAVAGRPCCAEDTRIRSTGMLANHDEAPVRDVLKDL